MINAYLSLCLFLALQSPAAAHSTPASAPAPDRRPRLAIADFRPADGTDPRDTWIPTAIAETLAWRMKRIPDVITLPTMRLVQARRELQEDASPPDWPRVIHLLGGQLYLRGTSAGDLTSVTLSLELIDMTTPGAAPRSTRLGPARLFDVLDDATRWLLSQCGVSRLDERLEKTLLGPPCTSPSALEYFAKSIDAMRVDNARDAYFYADRMFEYDAAFRPGQLYFAQLELHTRPADRAKTAVRLRRLSEMARAANDAFDAAEIEHSQGFLLMLAHSFDSAQLRFESALQAARAVRDPFSEIGALNSLSDLCVERATTPDASLGPEQRQKARLDALQNAAGLQERCLEILRGLNDVVAEAPTAVKLALLYQEAGDLDRALAMHERALAAARAADSRRGQANSWLLISQVHRRAGRPQGALAALETCMKLVDGARRTPIRLTLADVLQDPSINRPADALRELEAAWKDLEPGSDFVQQLRCLRALAELRYRLGSARAAIEALENAADVAHALEAPEEQAIRTQLDEWKRGVR